MRPSLRTTLHVQERWFSGEGAISPEQRRVLQALPIFPLAAPALPAPRAAAGAPSTSAGNSAPAAGSSYVDLLDERFLAPEGTDAALLSGSAFLAPGAPGEDRVLAAQQLGVTALSRERLLVDHLLPRRVLHPYYRNKGINLPHLFISCMYPHTSTAAPGCPHDGGTAQETCCVADIGSRSWRPSGRDGTQWIGLLMAGCQHAGHHDTAQLQCPVTLCPAG